MRYILIILVFLSVGANAQMVIKAHPNYRPLRTGILLDDYPDAAAAYSLRKVRTAYTGAAIRVRKDTTGQPEQDVFFTAAGDLDTASLKSFLNARSGFVVTWYDQSGNGRNASQATAANQPQISNLGTIRRRNDKPSLFFSSGNNFLQAFRFAAPNINFSFSIIHEAQSATAQNIPFSDEYTGSGPFNIRGTYFSPNTYIVNRSGALASVSSGATFARFLLYANSVKYLSNNTAVASTNNTSSSSVSMLMSGNTFTEGSTNLVLGRYQTSSALGLNGHISEFICYRGVNADIDGVRNNQIIFYNIQ